MKRLFIGLAAVLVLAVGAVLIAPSFIDLNPYKDRIAAEIGRATGRTVAIDGGIALELLPAPHVRVTRVRVGNLTMTNHPIHLHGHEFLITGTDGGPTPKSTRQYEVTADIAVGQMRQMDFLADEEGDWAFHCHKSHHTMNAMGHGVPTMIGVDHRGVARQITKLIPDYMVMGERGMKDMTEMEMPLPDNTAPMMAGQGPFGAVGMGGMFSVVKVRKDQKPGDYGDPGWYPNPKTTVARRVSTDADFGAPVRQGPAPAPVKQPEPMPMDHSKMNHGT